MNYYEHHLGDYAKDTAHLSMLETGAYRLLLDRYYGTEQGIPADQAHRIARARSKDEKAAVDAVLDEFFRLEDGVWINKRADEEIARYKENRPRADEKRENDKERQRRARERRKVLFEELSALGVHMAWNATSDELHAALDSVKSQARNAPVTPPVTRDNTATQTPDTRHHKPKEEYQTTTVHLAQEPVVVPSTDTPGHPDPITTRAIELTALLRKRGAKLQASDPKVRAWAESGITDAQALAALEKAQQQRADKADASPVNSGYLESIIRAGPVGMKSRGKPSLAEQNAAAAAEAKRMIFGEGIPQ